MQHESLTRTVIGCAIRVHRALGPGYLESVYQNALAWELRAASLPVECGRRLLVRYGDVVVGEFSADMVVGRHVLVENKAVRAIAPAHEAQLVSYLTTTGIEIGLLLNFGSDRLQFRRKTRTYRAPSSGQEFLNGQDFQDGQDGGHSVH
jgi:GxxExxY protein